MKAFEDVKYSEWRAEVEAKLPEILKSNLLVKPKDRHDLVLPANTDPDTGTRTYLYMNHFLIDS